MERLIVSKVIVSLLVLIIIILIYITGNNTQYEFVGYVANSIICAWYGAWMLIIDDWWREHKDDEQ